MKKKGSRPTTHDQLLKQGDNPLGDPLQVVLTRIATITANLTATQIDVEDLRKQMDELTTEILDLAAGKLGSDDC